MRCDPKPRRQPAVPTSCGECGNEAAGGGSGNAITQERPGPAQWLKLNHCFESSSFRKQTHRNGVFQEEANRRLS